MARKDPYKNYRFLVEIDGIVQAGFAECSGFGSEVQVVEYREGGDPTTARKLPGMAKYPDITLKWGLTDSRELYDWHLTAINGQIERKNGSVVVLDDAGQEQARWNFFSAWPSKYTGPSFNAKGNDIAIDSLTVCCERMARA
ncbi:phage tail protein [Nodosilinea sp. PGN35]|uniref:phage tail protein n=1 Tax=Nodosilinea sp. PGN35 TaxID=3020489 RepID=UPI0023B3215B|nr:phage tail protein [Nodosilinea sp. TSF1-S3]MDF0367891.1 phage tail protein [Nodosilinea sp. TSF1-S3]